MSRVLSKLCVAITVLVLFITFFSFRHSLPPRHAAILGLDSSLRSDDGSAFANNDFLRGATLQKPALASPPSYAVSEEILSGSNQKLSPQEHSQKKDNKNNQVEKNKNEEEHRRLKNEDQVAKVNTEYQKIKIYTSSFEVPKGLIHDPKGPKPNEIVLLAASDGKGHNGGIDNILADVTPNRQEYADLHGYHYLFINITKYNIGNARPVWAKLPAIVEAFNLFPEAKWVWWLDLDAIIMTPTVELTAHILAHDVLWEKMKKGVEMNKSGGGGSGIITAKNPDMGNIDIIVAQDQNGLNAGSFFIRRSEFSRILIDMWSDPLFIRENWNGQEQDALWHLVKEHPTILEHLALVSQRQINAYPVNNVADMSWEFGDLVVHIAGCWVKKECNDQWKKFMGRRIPISGSLKGQKSATVTATAITAAVAV